jgi:hypothetical protein
MAMVKAPCVTLQLIGHGPAQTAAGQGDIPHSPLLPDAPMIAA